MKIFVKKLLFTTLLVLMSVLGIAQCDSFDCDNVVGRDVEVKHASAPAGTTITAIQGTTTLASGAFTHPQTVTIPCEGATTITLSYPDGRPDWVWNAESCIAENPAVPGEYCVTLSLSGIDGHVLKDSGLVTPIPREDLSCEADLCPPPPTCICDFFLADSKGARIDTVACDDEFIYFSASAPEGCDGPVVDGTTIYFDREPIGDYPIPFDGVEPGTYTVSLNPAVTSCDNEAQVTFVIPTCSSPCCTAIHLVDGEGNVVADAENTTVPDSYCDTPIYVQCVDNPALEIVSGDVNGTALIRNQVPEGITESGTVTASFGTDCEVLSGEFGFPSCESDPPLPEGVATMTADFLSFVGLCQVCIPPLFSSVTITHSGGTTELVDGIDGVVIDRCDITWDADFFVVDISTITAVSRPACVDAP